MLAEVFQDINLISWKAIFGGLTWFVLSQLGEPSSTRRSEDGETFSWARLFDIPYVSMHPMYQFSAESVWLAERLNEVEVDPFSREGKNDATSRQENHEEKTFPETVLAVADRVYSRQGIARSILIQSVLVKIPSN